MIGVRSSMNRTVDEHDSAPEHSTVAVNKSVTVMHPEMPIVLVVHLQVWLDTEIKAHSVECSGVESCSSTVRFMDDHTTITITPRSPRTTSTTHK